LKVGGKAPGLALILALSCLSIFAADWFFPPDLSRYRIASTEVQARDGTPLAAFPVAGGIWRLRTGRADVDPRYVELLVAAEDRHFWSHSGIDPSALLRAAWQWAGAGRIVSGGSTLTMQTARLLEPHRRGVIGKLHDLLRAVQLERRYTKDQILGMYLTLAPFGANVEGVRAASLVWFGHDASQLSPSEAALLVALPQSPSHRRPDRHAARAQAAVGRLLIRLARAGSTPAWLPATAALPSATRHAMPRLAGLFAAAQARRAAPGAVLRTTIDAGLQRRLEALLARELASVEPQVGVAAMIVGNHGRDVLASVGGRGPNYPGGALDLTATRRSPGSALKPFIYGAAFDALLLHPLTKIPDAPGLVAGYAPHNFDYAFHGAVTAQTALRQSFNVPAVEVLSRVGPGRFVASLRQAGAKIALPGNRASLAVALGGLGIDLQDMVMLYAALGDDGQAAPLVTQPGPPAARQTFMGPLAVYYLCQVLEGSPPPPGVAYAMLTGGRDIAFKTGTSYGFRDAWAVGYSNATTVGVWTGRVDGTPRPGAFGRATAAPLMLDIFALLPPEESAPRAPPQGAILADTTDALPAGLRWLGGFPENHSPGPALVFPPPGTTVDLLTADRGSWAPVELRVAGGQAPYRWLVNSAPIAGQGDVLPWRPDGPGSVRVTVVDAGDRVASGVFQLQPPQE
jgi:penicillin-binding protein 1C